MASDSLRPMRTRLVLSLIICLGLAFPRLSPPARAAEEDILDLGTELETEEWKEKVEKKFEEMPLEPEDYSVAGTKHPQRLSQAPSAITVLDEKDIRAYRVSSLEELLRIIPGLDMAIITPADKQVGIRGFYPIGSNTVLVLVDGREVNVTFIGGVFWNLLPITVDDIKKIEIIRGPGSALYGANAYSGVINIITKGPREERRAEAISEIGVYNTELGTMLFKAKGAQNWKRLGLKVSADYNELRSFSNTEEISSKLERFYLRSHYDISGNAQIDLDGGFLFDDSRFYSLMGELPVSNSYLGHLNLSGKWENLSCRFSWHRFDFDVEFNSPLLNPDLISALFEGHYPVEAGIHNFDTGLEYYLYIGQGNRLTLGVSYLLNIFSSPILEKKEKREDRFGVYFQNEWSLHPSLNFIAGFRYDYNSQTEEDYSPRISLVYSLDRNNTFRASLARAFRKPTFFEYGMEVPAFKELDILYSPDLGNEHINSFELGYNSHLFRRLNLAAAFHYNQYRDVTHFGDGFKFENYHLYADGIGGEIAADFIITPDLRGFANCSYLEPIDKSEDGEMAMSVNRYTKFRANFGLNFLPAPGISLSLLGDLIGPREDYFFDPQESSFLSAQEVQQKIDTQFLLGIRASYSFLRDRAEFGIKVFNLLDDNSRQYPGSDWTHDIDGDGVDDIENFGGEKLARTITGFLRLSW